MKTGPTSLIVQYIATTPAYLHRVAISTTGKSAYEMALYAETYTLSINIIPITLLINWLGLKYSFPSPINNSTLKIGHLWNFKSQLDK